jgi:hypothetical protein
MALFELDPRSIASRTRVSGAGTVVPTLPGSILRGATGFTMVSIAGFAPWPIIDRWLPALGEVGLYIVSTAVFIGSSGPLLHRLIIGGGSLSRFYKLFTLAFTAYAVVWVLCWTWLRDHAGSLAGLLGGTAVMGAVFAFAFNAWRESAKVIAALFVLNTLGYFAGGKVHGMLTVHHRSVAILLWSVCYGLGLGAGLGIAFYLCQSKARELVAERKRWS